MVVLILVVLWVVVLTPLGVRRLRERQGQSSIESFHEQLHLLEPFVALGGRERLQASDEQRFELPNAGK